MKSASTRFVRAGVLGATATVWLVLTAGCASPAARWAVSAVLPPGLAEPRAEVRVSRNVFAGMQRYAAERARDFVDMFEVGGGWGMGMGAQVSPLVGFVGLEGGRYTWWGVFGAHQTGTVPDRRYLCVGVPISPFIGVASLFSRRRGATPTPIRARLLEALLVALGFEDGIGGDRVATMTGYGGGSKWTYGPVSMDPVQNNRITSDSGPIGGSIAVGPLAVMARVRAAAVVNFIFGFVGYHPFAQRGRTVVFGAHPANPASGEMAKHDYVLPSRQ